MAKRSELHHYIVKESERIACIFKKYDDLEEAVKHCMIYTKANEGKPIVWWVISTERVVPEGHMVDWNN